MQVPPDRPPRKKEHITPTTPLNDGKRLRDNATPIFQRDIGYKTPKRDGSTKHGKRFEGKDRYEKK